MNTEDWKDTFPTQTSQSLPKEVWEKKLLENEKTAPVPQAAAEPEEPSAETLAPGLRTRKTRSRPRKSRLRKNRPSRPNTALTATCGAFYCY